MGASDLLRLLLLPIGSFATRVALPGLTGLPVGAKLIAGVPVYDYSLLFQGSQVRTQQDLESEPPQARVLLEICDGVVDEDLQRLCSDHPQIGLCGHMNGVHYAEFHGIEQDLAQFFTDAAGVVCSAEPDLMTDLTAEHEQDTSYAARYSQLPIIIEEEDCFPNLERIGYYSSSRTGRGIHVYVLDTGIQDGHVEFENRAVREFEVQAVLDTGLSAYVSQAQACASSGSSTCAQDIRGHGTHVAGTVAAKSYGIAPKALVHGVKVLDDEGRGPESWILAGLDHILSHAVTPAVVSLSLGMPAAQATIFGSALEQVVASGFPVVVSAGNAGEDACDWTPANVNGVITVGSSTVQDRVSSFSNWGTCVDLFAPGEDIMSLGHWTTTETTEKTGTSMSCPHVSGAAALLLEANPTLPPFEVKRGIINHAQTDLLWGALKQSPNFRLSISENGNEICDKHAGQLYTRIALGSLGVLLGPLVYVAWHG